MAPEAIAARSSSANKATADSEVSTIPTLLFPSTSRDVGTVSSKALAAGRMVATSSKEVAAPQTVSDFFDLFNKAVFTFCSPSIHL